MNESERDEALRLAKEAGWTGSSDLSLNRFTDQHEISVLVRLIALATAPLKKLIAELEEQSVKDLDYREVMRRHAERTEAELAALKQQREGWVMVPKKPTPEMLEAMVDSAAEYLTFGIVSALVAYDAMLAAAPSPTGEKG